MAKGSFVGVAMAVVAALALTPDLKGGWGGGGCGGGAARGSSAKSRSSTVAAQSFTINWETPKLNLYDGYNVNDFYSALPADYKQSDEPLLVYITTEASDASKRVTELEQSVEQDESVALSAKLFRAIRIKGDHITKEHQFWSVLGGKELPRIAVIATDGTKVGSYDGKAATGSNVFGLMKRAAAKTYKTSLDVVVKQRRELVDEMDRIEAKIGILAEQKKTATAAKAKEIEDQTAKLTKDLADVRTREIDLLKKVSEDKKVAKS